MKDNVLKLLRDILLGDPVAKQEERIELAMLAVAKLDKIRGKA